MSVRLGVTLLAGLCLTACGSSTSTPASPTLTPTPGGGGASVSVVSGASTLTSAAYSPNPVTVSVGATVTWVNNDSTTHTSTADNGNFATGNIPPGGSVSVTAKTAGSFVYHCSIHPGMVGTLIVQ